MRASDFEIRNHHKLDIILAHLCELVIRGQQGDQDLGMVAAAVLDPDNQCVTAVNYPHENGQRVHAERAAIDAYNHQYGKIPSGSIIITTCSPCSHDMDERYGESCTDLINQSGVKKVYAGFQDPTQSHSHKRFHMEVTRNSKINQLCQSFADTFLKTELNELSFMGSQCTKDCSGHRAGYSWYKKKGYEPASWSRSFNNGAAIAASGR